MLKILQHVKSFQTTYGGVERMVEELVPGLNRYPDLAVDVLCQGPKMRDYALPNRGRVFQVKTDLAVSTACLSWQDFRYWQHIAARYDIIHVHAPWPQSNLNLLLKRSYGAVVVHWHSDVVRQRVLYPFYKPLERWLLQRADKICVTSPKLLEQSATLDGFRYKAVAIPIGIKEAEYAIGEEEIRGARACYAGRFIIFTLGRLVPYKGFEYLVRAAALLAPRGLILIAGDGPLRPKLETLIRENQVEEKVKILGRVTNRELELYMRACDVFCLPSTEKSEAFGIVQIEAMRAGRPLVSTRIQGSGVDWVNQHGVTGFTVEPCKPTVLAGALNQLMAKPQIVHQFGTNARRRYERIFTAKKMAEQVRTMYLSLSSVAADTTRTTTASSKG